MAKNEVDKKRYLVFHDNLFNKTDLSVITNTQTSILYAVLNKVSEGMKADSGNYTAEITYKELREMTNKPNISTRELNALIYDIMKTLVEFYVEDNGEIKKVIAPLFAVAYITEGARKFDVELSPIMGEKLIIKQNTEYTVIDVQELSSIKSPTGQELYRMLRQFKSTGQFMIGANQWRKHFETPESYSDYDLIRKQILPAYRANKDYFENLKVNVAEGDRKVPPTIIFKFKKTTSSSLDEEQQIIDYIAGLK